MKCEAMRRLVARTLQGWHPALVIGAGFGVLVVAGLIGWVRADGFSADNDSRTGARSVGQQGKSGIQGRILLTCPGAGGGEPVPCGQPIRARQDVYREGSGRLVASFRSSSTGSYRVELPPGDYLIAQPRKPYKGMPACFFPTTAVSVPKGRFVARNLLCDTGVR